MANKNFEIKNGLEVGNGLINVSSGDVSIRRGMSTTNRIRIESANIYADTNLTVAGNLTVQGDTTTLNVGTLDVEDKNITLNKGSGDTSGSANGAGITIQDAVDASTDATFLWNSANDQFELSHDLRLDNATHVLLERGGELRSLDTGGSTRTIARINGSNDLEYGYSGSGAVKFMGGGSYTERMRVHSDGKVGIGTTAPAVLLHVESTSIPQMRVAYNSSNYQNLSYEGSDIIGGSHVFKISGSEKMRLGTSGRLGIGVTSPAAILHINGTGDAIRVESTNSGAGGAQIDLLHFSASPADEDTNGAINFGGYYSGAASAYSGAIRSIWTDVNARHGRLEFLTRDDSSFPTALTISHESNVGIGTTSPGTSLQIGDGTGDEYITIDKSATGASGILFKNAGNNKVKLLCNSSEEFELHVNNALKMYVKENGNVGIGTNNPSGTLHVVGTYKINANYGAGSQNVALGEGAYAAGSGSNNTVIGHHAGNDLTSSNFNTVVGAFALDAQTTGGRNVAIGYAALSTDSTGGRSVAVGWNALGNQNLANDDISYNVAVGYDAMANNTYGTKNVAIGYACLDANTSGYNNTAVGDNALSTNQTGDQNTAIGRAALNESTGTNNTAVGNHALIANTTADENTAVGSFALADNTTGTRNTAVGLFSLISNVTGSDNVAVGRSALQSCTTGQNTAVGSMAGDAITSGANNTVIGYEAAGKMTTGYDNVYAGRAAGLDSTSANGNVVIGVEALENNTTGSEIVAIGKQAGRNASGGGSVYIGYQSAFNQTSGIVNVCVGQHTMYNSGTGFSNTCLGYSAGYHIGDGYRNVAIGHAVSIPSGQHHRYAIGYNNGGGSNTAYQALSVHNGSSAYVRITCGSSSVSSSSDERIKKDIEDCTVGLSFINRLRPVNYKLKLNSELPDPWQDDDVDDYDSGWHNGFIAQEVKAALDAENIPASKMEVWSEDSDNGGLQSLAEASLIPMLVKSIQELKTELDAAKARIETLEG